MALRLDFVCTLPNGMHARPANVIENMASGFLCEIFWVNKRTQIRGDAKSVLSIVSTDSLLNDECILEFDGLDEDEAYSAFEKFIKEDFIHCDEPLSEPCEDNIIGEIPRTLRHLKLNPAMGEAVCSGIGMGKLLHFSSFNFNNPSALPAFRSQAEEKQDVEAAIEKIKNHMETGANGLAHDIVKAQISILKDKRFKNDILAHIEEHKSAAAAIVQTVCDICSELAQSASCYIQERQLDIKDIGLRLMAEIYHLEPFSPPIYLKENSIIFTDNLTPSQFLGLDKTKLKGLVLSSGGKTSHTVILARSFNIPTIVSVAQDDLIPYNNQLAVIDADNAIILPNPDDKVIKYYNREIEIKEILKKRQTEFLYKKGRTKDKIQLEIAANIASEAEATNAFNLGAEGIGLFRTEMLYMDRHTEPSEEEMFRIYKTTAEAAQGRRVIVRTVDIGGDKPVHYLNIPSEDNPFLGYRAVRIYEEFLDLFKKQLRSILRASAFGRLNIMIPMISSVEEIRWVKTILAEVKQELAEQNIRFDRSIPLGIMLEVPSTLFLIDILCSEVDFFSIGSNDLTQYLMAVDRDNAKIAHLYDSFNPAFIRALDYAVKMIHQNKGWVGICGELASDRRMLPLLVGMGVNEVSMPAALIGSTKENLSLLHSEKCKQHLEAVLQCATSEEIGNLMDHFSYSDEKRSILDEDCIMLNAHISSKEEAIKTMVDNLLLAGRTQKTRALEDDLWAREEVFSTALGFGFAIPHTKSIHIEHSTISVARLNQPIKWGEEEVQLIIMLTLNPNAGGDAHMKIFSKLARKIMDETFRNKLMAAENATYVIEILTKELELEMSYDLKPNSCFRVYKK